MNEHAELQNYSMIGYKIIIFKRNINIYKTQQSFQMMKLKIKINLKI